MALMSTGATIVLVPPQTTGRWAEAPSPHRTRAVILAA